eukprot:1160514-Pelagomonas_calceolata.AAC.16
MHDNATCLNEELKAHMQLPAQKELDQDRGLLKPKFNWEGSTTRLHKKAVWKKLKPRPILFRS